MAINEALRDNRLNCVIPCSWQSWTCDSLSLNNPIRSAGSCAARFSSIVIPSLSLSPTPLRSLIRRSTGCCCRRTAMIAVCRSCQTTLTGTGKFCSSVAMPCSVMDELSMMAADNAPAQQRSALRPAIIASSGRRDAGAMRAGFFYAADASASRRRTEKQRKCRLTGLIMDATR